MRLKFLHDTILYDQILYGTTWDDPGKARAILAGTIIDVPADYHAASSWIANGVAEEAPVK